MYANVGREFMMWGSWRRRLEARCLAWCPELRPGPFSRAAKVWGQQESLSSVAAATATAAGHGTS